MTDSSNASNTPDLGDDAVVPTTGLTVLHLFCHVDGDVDDAAMQACVAAAQAEGAQVVAAQMLGHKADVAFMALHPDMRVLHRLQRGLRRAGLGIGASYVSITEVSEYTKGMPAEMLSPRLYPVLPPAGKPAFCFYPMTKRRNADANWYTLPYDERLALMHEHGGSGRKFAGRITQLITGSTGLDDFEWGVTLFGVHTDDIKDVVYTLRFDRASALYGEFGDFYVGAVTPIDQLLA
ncbi:MAG TPA: chlorite dismutase family protein [Ilumatobacteraceae bacterium]|nr:chlorite dismutase family protein [Ilumatobacteraceae bacterium]